MGTIRVFAVLLVGSAMLLSAHGLSLTDPNTCRMEETFNATKNVIVKQPISVKSYEWCLNVPPRCTIYRTEVRSVTETQTIPMKRSAVGCCPGYKISIQDTCAPVCSSGCFGGSCIAPEICANRQIPTSPLVTPKPLRDKSESPTSTAATSTILEDNDLQIEDSLITVTKQDSVSKNVSTKPTPLYVPAVTSTDPSSVLLKQGYNNLSTSTTMSYSAALSDSIPKTTTPPRTSLVRSDKGEGVKIDHVSTRPDIGNMTLYTTTDKEEAPTNIERSYDQNVSENILEAKEISTEQNLDMKSTRMNMKTDIKNMITARPSEGRKNLAASTSNATVRRDPSKYTTSLENRRSNNDTTYSKAQQMNLSDRFVYGVGISVGVMFAIIMVTLVITKHQHYLQGIDPRCGNTRNSRKCKAAHKNEAQETTLHVLVTREVTNQPVADCENTCISSTRNSTITVYNFPPPVSAFDGGIDVTVPLRTPVRPFGDYDFPSPMAENVYDEIPAHRETGEGYRCFVRQ